MYAVVKGGFCLTKNQRKQRGQNAKWFLENIFLLVSTCNFDSKKSKKVSFKTTLWNSSNITGTFIF